MEKVNQYELGKKMYQDWRVQEYSKGSFETLRELGKENINVQELKRGFVEERSKALSLTNKKDNSEAFYSAVDEVGTNHFPLLSEFVKVKICYGYGIVFDIELHAEVGVSDEVLKEKAIEHFKEFMPTIEQVQRVNSYLEEKRAWLQIEHEKMD